MPGRSTRSSGRLKGLRSSTQDPAEGSPSTAELPDPSPPPKATRRGRSRKGRTNQQSTEPRKAASSVPEAAVNPSSLPSESSSQASHESPTEKAVPATTEAVETVDSSRIPDEEVTPVTTSVPDDSVRTQPNNSETQHGPEDPSTGAQTDPAAKKSQELITEDTVDEAVPEVFIESQKDSDPTEDQIFYDCSEAPNPLVSVVKAVHDDASAMNIQTESVSIEPETETAAQEVEPDSVPTDSGDQMIAEAEPESTAEKVEPDSVPTDSEDQMIAEAEPESAAAEVEPDSAPTDSEDQMIPPVEVEPESDLTEAEPESAATETIVETTPTQVELEPAVPETEMETALAAMEPETSAKDITFEPPDTPVEMESVMVEAEPVTTATVVETESSGQEDQIEPAPMDAISVSEVGVSSSKKIEPESSAIEVEPESTSTETERGIAATETEPESTSTEIESGLPPTETESGSAPTVREPESSPTEAETADTEVGPESGLAVSEVAEMAPQTDTKEIQLETAAPDVGTESSTIEVEMEVGMEPESAAMEINPETAATEVESELASTEVEPELASNEVQMESEVPEESFTRVIVEIPAEQTETSSEQVVVQIDHPVAAVERDSNVSEGQTNQTTELMEVDSSAVEVPIAETSATSSVNQPAKRSSILKEIRGYDALTIKRNILSTNVLPTLLSSEQFDEMFSDFDIPWVLSTKKSLSINSSFANTSITLEKLGFKGFVWIEPVLDRCPTEVLRCVCEAAKLPLTVKYSKKSKVAYVFINNMVITKGQIAERYLHNSVGIEQWSAIWDASNNALILLREKGLSLYPLHSLPKDRVFSLDMGELNLPEADNLPRVLREKIQKHFAYFCQQASIWGLLLNNPNIDSLASTVEGIVKEEAVKRKLSVSVDANFNFLVFKTSSDCEQYQMSSLVKYEPPPKPVAPRIAIPRKGPRMKNCNRCGEEKYEFRRMDISKTLFYRWPKRYVDLSKNNAGYLFTIFEPWKNNVEFIENMPKMTEDLKLLGFDFDATFLKERTAEKMKGDGKGIRGCYEIESTIQGLPLVKVILHHNGRLYARGISIVQGWMLLASKKVHLYVCQSHVPQVHKKVVSRREMTNLGPRRVIDEFLADPDIWVLALDAGVSNTDIHEYMQFAAEEKLTINKPDESGNRIILTKRNPLLHNIRFKVKVDTPQLGEIYVHKNRIIVMAERFNHMRRVRFAVSSYLKFAFTQLKFVDVVEFRFYGQDPQIGEIAREIQTVGKFFSSTAPGVLYATKDASFDPNPAPGGTIAETLPLPEGGFEAKDTLHVTNSQLPLYLTDKPFADLAAKPDQLQLLFNGPLQPVERTMIISACQRHNLETEPFGATGLRVVHNKVRKNKKKKRITAPAPDVSPAPKQAAKKPKRKSSERRPPSEVEISGLLPHPSPVQGAIRVGEGHLLTLPSAGKVGNRRLLPPTGRMLSPPAPLPEPAVHSSRRLLSGTTVQADMTPASDTRVVLNHSSSSSSAGTKRRQVVLLDHSGGKRRSTGSADRVVSYSDQGYTGANAGYDSQGHYAAEGYQGLSGHEQEYRDTGAYQGYQDTGAYQGYQDATYPGNQGDDVYGLDGVSYLGEHVQAGLGATGSQYSADQYGSQYGNQYSDQYGNQYSDQYGNQYGNQHSDQYGNRYGEQYSDQYGGYQYGSSQYGGGYRR